MHTQQKDTITPKLAPPGAGIPWIAKQALRFIILPLATKKMSKQNSFEVFHKEGSRILKAIHGRSAAELERRILVPPQRGLEDSSRYWSVHMALEHIMIVGNSIAGVIADLSNGRPHAIVADTARVKPLGEKDSAPVVAQFEAFMKEIQGRIESSIGDLNHPLKHKHPWFGPMNAQQWLWLIGTHQSIHRLQIQRIIERL